MTGWEFPHQLNGRSTNIISKVPKSQIFCHSIFDIDSLIWFELLSVWDIVKPMASSLFINNCCNSTECNHQDVQHKIKIQETRNTLSEFSRVEWNEEKVSKTRNIWKLSEIRVTWSKEWIQTIFIVRYSGIILKWINKFFFLINSP